MAQMNQYFVPGFGISRSVIQTEIKYHCGPEAIVRPYTHQGRDGFLVSTPGGPLTEAQLDDLRTSSKLYEERRAERAPATVIAVGHRSLRRSS